VESVQTAPFQWERRYGLKMAMYRIEFEVREDPWGKIGKSSLIGELLLHPDHPLWQKKVGEAWAGAHPSRPSRILSLGTDLETVIGKNPTLVLGEQVAKRYGAQLPFLFKILTIASPLSIQVHPSKVKAEKLHKEYPLRYPDASEKPEIGVAIRETKLLIGFRPLEAIKAAIQDRPALLSYFQRSNSQLENCTLKELYSKLLTANEDSLRKLNTALRSEIEASPKISEEDALFLELESQFPADSGPTQVYFLNLVRLAPSEGIFIPPDIPHAYLSGEIVECMATSDFVIRAGLTPKERDSESLLEVIDYSPFKIVSSSPRLTLSGEDSMSFLEYEAACSAFSLRTFSGTLEESFATPGPVLYFCLSGGGSIEVPSGSAELSPGSLLFLTPDCAAAQRVRLSGDFFRVSINTTT